MPGRPPKPTALHLIEGTGRKHRLSKRAGEPVVTEPIGEPPEWLPPEGAAEYRRLVQAMPEGVYTALDRGLLSLFCANYAEIVEKTRSGEQVTAATLRALVGLAGRLGLTPTDRARLNVTAREADENPFARL